MSFFTLLYKSALSQALSYVLNNPLFSAAGWRLKGALFESASFLFKVSNIDLQNYYAAGESFLESPSYPSGCSVGGGITNPFFSLKDYKKYKNEIIEHNLRLIWSVFDITAEGSAAGYDSHGMTLAVLYLSTGKVELVREKTSGDIDERGHITISNIFKKCPEIERGEALVMVTGAQTRAATQGDNMYSRANAHLHSDRMTREIFHDVMSAEELEKFRAAYALRINQEGPFSVGHNGDVNSKIKWEKFFLDAGFESDADSDSKEIPRIIRIVYECLMADGILGADQRFLEWLITTLHYNKVLNDVAKFEVNGQTRMLSFAEQKEVILSGAKKMQEAGAVTVTIACAVAARLIYLVDPTSIFVFETLTSIINKAGDVIPVTTILRGPKSGGMFLYRDQRDPAIPIKFASSLSNMRTQIKHYENEKQEEIPVDYITTGAKILVREGTVNYYALSDWQMAEIYQSGDGTPLLNIYDVADSSLAATKSETSPIIDYQLKGLEKTAILKDEGYFSGKSRVERTVIYETILGKIIAGPNFIRGKQIKGFQTEEPVSYALDNQYGVEIYLSYVTLLRNTRHIFNAEYGPNGEAVGNIKINPAAFFNVANPKLTPQNIEKTLKKIDKIYGFAEGTSRNVLGMGFSLANLEGLNGCFMNVFESNLARIERPRFDENTLALFVSNSGGTKPVVALAEEIIKNADEDFSKGPFVMSITNLVTSELAILTNKSLGASVTNMPWEKAVGSTFAAFTALQNTLALIVYIHEIKGLIKPQRAQHLYKALTSFPEVARITLSSAATREKSHALGKYIAGNGVDISYVGAFNGFDGNEGALKFAEMMQHPRVKFFSGAYEQHGQRATYLRSLRTNPGSLVILHIPNLETSIGSWMAQLIKEDKPRVGKIAVVTCEEDAMKLSENGADYVIPAPYGTTGNLFSDALTKLILDNLLSFAAILESNKIADEVTSWGNRLLEITTPEKRSLAHIPSILKELKIIFKKYKRLENGSMPPEERAKALHEIESQRADGIISDEERDSAIAKIYREMRSISIIGAETRDFINDLFSVLFSLDAGSEDEASVFYSLVNDLILEFSNRGLAMKLADDRFENVPYLSKMAIHYQGISKIIGANPIKPDNIAKFQQGWGISSFILDAGRRFSDPQIDSFKSFEAFLKSPGERAERFVGDLEKLGMPRANAHKLIAALKFITPQKLQKYNAFYNELKSYKFLDADPAKTIEYQNVSREFINTAVKENRPVFVINRTAGRLHLEMIFIDKFGDIDSLITLDGDSAKYEPAELSGIYETDPFIKSQTSFIHEWFSEMRAGEINDLLMKMSPMQLVMLEKKELVKQFETLIDKRNLIGPLAALGGILAEMDVDPYGFTINDLKTLRNISNAISGYRGGSPYVVQKKPEVGRLEYYGMREKEKAFGMSKSKSSSFDKPGKLKGNKKIACVGGRLKMGYGKDGAPVVIIPWYNVNADLEKLVLLHPEIDESITIGKKIETLGDKYNLIANHVSEHYEWDDNYLNLVSMVDLMMLSDEEIADDRIISALRGEEEKSHKGAK